MYLYGSVFISPGLRVTTGAHQWQCTHNQREQPTDSHYVDGSAELEPTIQVYGVSDSVPTFTGDNHQRKHGQHARKHCQETSDFATNACIIINYTVTTELKT